MSSARKRGFIAVKVLIIQFKWDFSDNILLENDDFSMVKTFFGKSHFKIDFCCNKLGEIAENHKGEKKR